MVEKKLKVAEAIQDDVNKGIVRVDSSFMHSIGVRPGDIVEIRVKNGQVVKTGDPLCVLDAMKMKNTIHAPQGGTIAEVCVSQGQSVEYGVVLFRFG